ncbi:MAG TPA: ROK family protein [Galbitalea sp.]|jgi:glucokinase|nr:ROK family protein [Galbitalea sp.]
MQSVSIPATHRVVTGSGGRELVLALDLGATKVESALVDADGRVLDGSRFRAPTGSAASSEQLAGAVRSVLLTTLGTLPVGSRLIGAGVGTAGPIDLDGGLVSPLNLAVWREYPLRSLVEDIVGVPTILRMDGLCITLAEHWVGAAMGLRNAMGMIVSTGIGGGLILGGVTVPGPSGNAGHIGHIEVGGFDDECACGGIGCVEAIASGPRTVAWANRFGWAGSTGEQLAADHRTGHPIAVAAVERAGRALGHAIASAASLVDVDTVAIGGGFAQVSPALFDHIRTAIAKRRAFDFVSRVRVVPSALGGDGPLIGAAALVHRSELVG